MFQKKINEPENESVSGWGIKPFAVIDRATPLTLHRLNMYIRHARVRGRRQPSPLNTCPCDSSCHLFGSRGDYCPGPALWGRLIAATRELLPLLQTLSYPVSEIVENQSSVRVCKASCVREIDGLLLPSLVTDCGCGSVRDRLHTQLCTPVVLWSARLAANPRPKFRDSPPSCSFILFRLVDKWVHRETWEK